MTGMSVPGSHPAAEAESFGAAVKDAVIAALTSIGALAVLYVTPFVGWQDNFVWFQRSVLGVAVAIPAGMLLRWYVDTRRRRAGTDL